MMRSDTLVLERATRFHDGAHMIDETKAGRFLFALAIGPSGAGSHYRLMTPIKLPARAFTMPETVTIEAEDPSPGVGKLRAILERECRVQAAEDALYEETRKGSGRRGKQWEKDHRAWCRRLAWIAVTAAEGAR